MSALVDFAADGTNVAGVVNNVLNLHVVLDVGLAWPMEAALCADPTTSRRLRHHRHNCPIKRFQGASK